MKKNKTIAYMLAATLLVGGTFLGTKALFTDNIGVAGELEISTGDVDIEVVGTNDWVLDRNGNEKTSDGTKGITDVERESDTRVNIEHGVPAEGNKEEDGGNIFANNLKPGDRLYKTITIQNQGTLVADITLGDNFINEDESNKLGNLKGLITPNDKVYVNGSTTDDTDGIFTLNPGETATITLELNVNLDDYEHKAPGTAGTDFNSDNQENYVANLNGAWTLEAVQLTEATDGDDVVSQPGR